MFVFPLFVWFVTQLFKASIHVIRGKPFRFALLWASGGMPSSHSAFMTSVTTVIALEEGVGSMLFLLAFAITCVVLHDAVVVRRQVGIHAEILNGEIKHNKASEWKMLPVAIGHTIPEMVGGSLFGILLTYLFWSIWEMGIL